MIKQVIALAFCSAVLFHTVPEERVLMADSADTFTGRYVSQTVFTPSDEAFLNPYKGYAPWAANLTPESVREPDFSLAFAILSWKDFEPQKGVYDFEAFERHNHFQALTERNVKFIVRLICDYPTTTQHIDIPQWLYDETEGAGVFYENSGGAHGFVPDYSNPYFIERHRLAVEALAERYDQSPDIAFVQLGSLGHWGEWHNVMSPESPFPDEAVTDIYAGHYADAFQRVLLQMRRPLSFAKARENIGFYNDLMGYAVSTYEWLNWISDAGLRDFYNTAPSGGEFASTNKIEEFFSTLYGDVKQMILDSNTTFAGGKPPAGDEYKANSDDLLKTMGYRFRAESVRFLNTRDVGAPLAIELDVTNDGVAPFYYEWNFHVLVTGSDGSTAATLDTGWDARDLPPGQTVTLKASLPVSLPPGEYTLALGLFDPALNTPGVRFANLEDDGSMLLSLGNITVG